MTRILAGNWKMNLGLAEARSLLLALRAGRDVAPSVRMVLFPPFTALASIASMRESRDPDLGAQNCHAEPKGAFTGEVAAEQALDAGAVCVLVGHSERRRLFGEDDTLIHGKLRAAWRAGLTPYLCIGEPVAERERRRTREVLARQIRRAREGSPAPAPLVVAYEPVWAIGTGVVASTEEVAEAHDWARQELSAAGRVDPVAVLYGGSVDPRTAAPLAGLPGVDGFLVGGASLGAASFLAIAKVLEDARPADRPVH